MRKLLRFLLWTAIIVGVIVGVARATAIRWWKVPDDDPYLEASVAPSLRGGDWVLLWRLTEPRFGDLVLCPEPGAPERVVVARIIGEPGDRVVVKGATLRVNRADAETEQACTESTFTVKHPTTGTEVEEQCQIEAIAGASHKRGSAGGVQPVDVDTQVETGKVFLVSDNRLLPYDSRDFGQAERSTCKETIFFRVVSAKGFFDVASRFVFIE
jgi:signal peptidase I